MEKYGATVIASGVDDLPRPEIVCQRKSPEPCQNDLSHTAAWLRRPGCAEQLFLPGRYYIYYIR